MCNKVHRWWPNGEARLLYQLELAIGAHKMTKRIGFSTRWSKTEEDAEGGKGMVFSVNGRDIFAKGSQLDPP